MILGINIFTVRDLNPNNNKFWFSDINNHSVIPNAVSMIRRKGSFQRFCQLHGVRVCQYFMMKVRQNAFLNGLIQLIELLTTVICNFKGPGHVHLYCFLALNHLKRLFVRCHSFFAFHRFAWCDTASHTRLDNFVKPLSHNSFLAYVLILKAHLNVLPRCLVILRPACTFSFNIILLTIVSVTCLTNFTSAASLTPDLKRKIDARIQEAKAKNIDLFSEKRCSGDCFGKPITKADLEKMTAFLGVTPESNGDKSLMENNASHKQEITVFVSNSVPKAALKGLVIEAGQMREGKVRFVIQGMVQDSMPKTAQLVENIGHPLEIDPKLFEVYQVTHVPVFMTTRGDKVYRLQGNVTLDFAVEKLSKSANDSIDKKEVPKK